MLVLRVCAVAIVLLIGVALEVAGQEEGNPSAPPAFLVEPTAPAETWTDEHTCIDADFMLPSEASGGSRGDLFNCAKALGLSKRDPAYATYDFRLWDSRFERERWTEQCDEAGDHTGSRYYASGTDRLWNVERPERVVTGTFDFTVVSALLDADADIWEVERQGVLWDLHDADGVWRWTWSVDVDSVSEGAPEEPRLTQYRGIDRSELARAVCEYLR